jgi:hypothetical protein
MHRPVVVLLTVSVALAGVSNVHFAATGGNETAA